MNKLSIKQKIYIIYFTLIIILIITGIHSFVQLTNINNNLINLYEYPIRVRSTVKNINIELLTKFHLINELIHTKDAKKVDSIAYSIQQCDNNIEISFKIVYDRYWGNLNDVESAYNSFQESKKILPKLLKYKKEKSPDSLLLIINDFKETNNIIFKNKVILNFTESRTEELVNSSYVIKKQTILINIIVFIILLISGTIIAIYLSNSIINSIKKFVLQTNEIFRISPKKKEFSHFNNEDELFNYTANELQQAYSNIELQNTEIILKNEQLSTLNLSLEEKVASLETIKSELTNAKTVAEVNYKLFYTLFDRAAIGVAIINSENGKFLLVNKKYCDLMGYSMQEMLELDFMKITYPDDLDSDLMNMAKLKQGAIFEFSLDKRLIKKDNTIVWIKLSVSILEKKENLLKTHIAIVEDISERINFENEIKKAKEKAEESDRLKTIFLTTISHELKTPLNAIIGFSDILEKDSSQNEKTLNRIKIIKQNSFKLAELLNDIIDVSRFSAGEIILKETSENLFLFVNRIFAFFNNYRTIIEKEIDLILINDIPEKLVVRADFKILQTILKHLIYNAFKFTNKGKIVIGCRLQENNEIEFWVQDTGIGISKDQLSFIFDYFRQADEGNKRKYGGIGIGLTIVKKFCDAINTEILVESDLENGSTFKFTLHTK